jgi:hypothetical protein
LVVVDQLTLVVFRAVQVEIHHLLVELFPLHRAAAAVVELQVVAVLTAVQAAVQDTHPVQVEQVMLAVTHHQKEATAAALALHQVFLQLVAVVVYHPLALLAIVQLAAATAVMVLLLILHGVLQLLQVKM